MNHPGVPNHRQPILQGRQLGKFLEERTRNPFIDIPTSIYVLARVAILSYLIASYVLFFRLPDVAPHAPLRAIAITFLVLTETAPLWMRFKGIGIVHPLYILSAYHFLKSILPNIAMKAQGTDWHYALPGLPSKKVAMLEIETMLITIVASLATYAGYYATRGFKWSMLRFHENKNVLLVAGVASYVIGVVSLLLLIDLSGSFEAHIKNITKGKSHVTYVKDATFAGAYFVLTLLIIMPPALWLLGAKKNPAYNPLFWVTALSAVAVRYLAGGRRSGVIIPMIVITAFWILRERKIAIGRLGVVAILGFISIGILGEFRKTNWRNPNWVTYEAFTEADLGSAITSSYESIAARRSQSVTVAIVANVPENVDYLYGRNYFDYLIRFVPRAIWKDKPRSMGLHCARVFYGRVDTGGIPPGSIGEAYWSGGPVGVLIVFFLWGIVLKNFANFFVRFNYSAFANLLYLLTIMKLSPNELAIRGTGYIIIPAATLLWAIGAMSIRFGNNSRQ